jgi:hypothetical protein
MGASCFGLQYCCLHGHVLSGERLPGEVLHNLQERSCQEPSCTDLVGTEPLVHQGLRPRKKNRVKELAPAEWR